VWDDPTNADPDLQRSRLRHEVLPLLEDVLQGGVAPALARTAELLADDLDALGVLAAQVHAAAATGRDLDVAVLAGQHRAVRTRVVRAWLHDLGASEVTAAHLNAIDALICGWHGQGAADLPGLRVRRTSARLVAEPPHTGSH
jgi:tRNA(Ile)-lysidine synthase